MPVEPDSIGPVLCHPHAPFHPTVSSPRLPIAVRDCPLAARLYRGSCPNMPLRHHARPRRHLAPQPVRRLCGCRIRNVYWAMGEYGLQVEISTRPPTYDAAPENRRTYFSSLRTRSMTRLASLIAASRLARVTPALCLPSPKSISHRHPVPSNN
jgi:hypothetical protein